MNVMCPVLDQLNARMKNNTHYHTRGQTGGATYTNIIIDRVEHAIVTYNMPDCALIEFNVANFVAMRNYERME